MPLLDHFNPPLHPQRHWESFHAQWAATIADLLNQKLPPDEYYAEIQVRISPAVEPTLYDDSRGKAEAEASGSGIATLATTTWAPPKAETSIPAIFPDVVEVQVHGGARGVVAAVVLVSPGNKYRDRERRGFAAKCAAYLQNGIGLIVVDVVTTRKGNLHNELVELLGHGDTFLFDRDELYATAYRPIRRPKTKRVDVWHAELNLGAPLPLLPLALDRDICLPLDLEPPYMEACQRSRLI